MPRPKRQFLATAEETLQPPASIEKGDEICRVIKAEGKNLYTVTTSGAQQLLVELPSKFRSSIWMKRGSYVLVNTQAFEDRENKLGGEIKNVVGDEKAWRKMSYWPPEFVKPVAPSSDSEEESTAGKMPPSDDSESDG